MQPVEPIMVIDLFPQERKQLLELFSELEAEDWEKPTICTGWTVKDIGLHLLGDDIGYLSRARDHFSNPFFRGKDPREWKSLVANIDTFVRALPHTYKDIPVAETTVLEFVVTGEAGDSWYLVGEANRWSLFKRVELQPITVVTMNQETCWRLFTKGMGKNQAKAKATIEGDQKLGENLLETISIIA